jgi:WD40 repeat protein
MQFLEGHSTAITALAFSPDGAALAIGGRDGTIHVFAHDHRKIAELEQARIESLVYAPNGTRLFLAGFGGWYGIERPTDPMNGVFVPRDSTPTTALAFLDDDVLAIGNGDRMKALAGGFELRNLATGRRLEPHFREPTGVRAVAAHPRSRTVAWTSAGKKLSVWPTQTLEPRTLGLAHVAQSLAFHPDGERLAIAQEWAVTIHDAITLDELATLKGHTGRVTALAYAPDGRRLATASWDQTVRIWDSGSGAVRETYDWGIGRVASLAFAPDGLRLAAGGETGTVAIIDVE